MDEVGWRIATGLLARRGIEPPSVNILPSWDALAASRTKANSRLDKGMNSNQSEATHRSPDRLPAPRERAYSEAVVVGPEDTACVSLAALTSVRDLLASATATSCSFARTTLFARECRPRCLVEFLANTKNVQQLHATASSAALKVSIAASAFIVMLPAYAQSPVPPSTTGKPASHLCGDNPPSSRPITLESVFGDGFENGIKWEKQGSVNEHRIQTRPGTAVVLRQNSSITKAIPLSNKGNHIFITFHMGAHSLETSPAANGQAPSAADSRADEFTSAEYYDGSNWVALAKISDGSNAEDGKLHAHASYIASLSHPSAFKLRFRIDGSDQKDYGYVDDVAVWVARIVPPPVSLPPPPR